MTRTVLTIEDQPDIRRLIRMTLEFKGFKVLEAGDGETGLAMARKEKPSLILLDVMMPGMNGLQVGQLLAQDPELQHTPVVMLSALGTEDDVNAGLRSGVRAYLVKPFSPWELIERVTQLTETSTAAPAAGGQ